MESSFVSLMFELVLIFFTHTDLISYLYKRPINNLVYADSDIANENMVILFFNFIIIVNEFD